MKYRSAVSSPRAVIAMAAMIVIVVVGSPSGGRGDDGVSCVLLRRDGGLRGLLGRRGGSRSGDDRGGPRSENRPWF